MRLLRGKPLYAAATVIVFAMSTSAQLTTGGGLPNLSGASDARTAQDSPAPAPSPDTAAKTPSAPAPASPSTSSPSTASPSRNSPNPTTGVITGAGSSAPTGISLTPTTTPTTAVITGDATEADGGALTGLPKLSGVYKIYPASVPPTHNAPFMQQSTLPEGTVFIAVGAVLGFMAMSVLLWRALVAWALHRSVKRAAMQQNLNDNKDLFRTPVAPFYKAYHDRDSTISLGGMGKTGRKEKKAPRPTTGSALANSSSLFFSPTAGAAAAGGINTPGNRTSSYLPAGYYAAGASSPGNGNSHVPMGQNISMSNLGPGRSRSIGQTPPDSPSLTANRSLMASNSTLNLNTTYNGDPRAPSAYLDDLFDAENAPPVPGHHGRSGSGHQSGGTPRF